MFYGRRQARGLKKSKKMLLESVLPPIQLTIEKEKIVCPTTLVGYQEIWLEIGFGNGDHLAYLAEKYPTILMIGCEPFISGVGSFLSTIQQKNLTNIRIFTGEAQSLLTVADKHWFSKAFLLFPDPWPKKRHHKRRFVQLQNLSLLEVTLKDNAELLFVTDHEEYRESALQTFHSCGMFEVESQGFQAPLDWIQTRFEEKGLKEGRRAYFIQLKKLLKK